MAAMSWEENQEVVTVMTRRRLPRMSSLLIGHWIRQFEAGRRREGYSRLETKEKDGLPSTDTVVTSLMMCLVAKGA